MHIGLMAERWASLQVKKQYELMRREVSKLAQQHQRDVHSLEQRFRQKMAGLASRFQASAHTWEEDRAVFVYV